MDNELDEEIKHGLDPVDFSNIGFFKAALGRHASHLHEEMKQKNQELATRLAQATFNQLEEQLRQDQEKGGHVAP